MFVRPPNRVTHTYRQQLLAPADAVFPLLCPVREAEWAEGWLPNLVLSTSGVAEPDCVFTTPAGDGEAVWYVTRHEPEGCYVEMLKITPGETACRLRIQLLEGPSAGQCYADVTYSHTSLGPAGDTYVAGFTADYYRGFMQQWELELNRFLQRAR
jgi:hypothetical protein